jgi:hypothetical protein
LCPVKSADFCTKLQQFAHHPGTKRASPSLKKEGSFGRGYPPQMRRDGAHGDGVVLNAVAAVSDRRSRSAPRATIGDRRYRTEAYFP